MTVTPERAIELLGDGFYDPVAPAIFPKHILRYRNQRWAAHVGLEGLSENDWTQYFGRFAPLNGSLPQPLALRYHGHQFRTYNPDIGDGRGFLFAQLRDDRGRLLDLGTKGSGQTPYSRFGDGRLTLKGGVREVLATEMLEALGVNTSTTFSLIETGEALTRNDEPSPTRSAVLVRLSHSHIRYGTFQRLAAYDDTENMARLVDYCLRYLFDETVPDALEDQVSLLLSRAVAGAADLAASYMAAGFVHGVLNTDNINITGESFDYGPYRFAPTYDLSFTAAYFDHGGLYAFGRQAEALHWNIYQLGKSLLTLVDQSVIIPALETFPAAFEQALVQRIFERLAVQPDADQQKNLALLTAMEQALTRSQVNLAQFYFDNFGGKLSRPRRALSPQKNAYESSDFVDFFARLDALAPEDTALVRLRNDYFAQAVPCHLLIDEIEAIWSAIESRDDWSLFANKLHDIANMSAAHHGQAQS